MMAWQYSLTSDIVCPGNNVLALTWQDADYLIEIILLEKNLLSFAYKLSFKEQSRIDGDISWLKGCLYYLFQASLREHGHSLCEFERASLIWECIECDNSIKVFEKG